MPGEEFSSAPESSKAPERKRAKWEKPTVILATPGEMTKAGPITVPTFDGSAAAKS